jgi:hypothetical protein
MAALCVLVRPAPAHAYKPGAHWILVSKTRDELKRLDPNDIIAKAIDAYPQCAAWGAIGPDIGAGDSGIAWGAAPWFDRWHYDRVGSQAKGLLQAALASNGPEQEKLQKIAFAAGWLTHVSGDMEVHGQVVNEVTGGLPAWLVEGGDTGLHGDVESACDAYIWRVIGGLDTRAWDAPGGGENRYASKGNFSLRFLQPGTLWIGTPKVVNDFVVGVTNGVFDSDGTPYKPNAHGGLAGVWATGYKLTAKDIGDWEGNIYRIGLWGGKALYWYDVQSEKFLRGFGLLDQDARYGTDPQFGTMNIVQKSFRDAQKHAISLLTQAERGDYHGFTDSWNLDVCEMPSCEPNLIANTGVGTHSTIGTVVVRIHTANVTNAGTDSAVKFGVGSSGGACNEKTLDVGGFWHDDFVQNGTDDYYPWINPLWLPSWTEKMWLRKDNGGTAPDWKADYVCVWLNGQKVLEDKNLPEFTSKNNKKVWGTSSVNWPVLFAMPAEPGNFMAAAEPGRVRLALTQSATGSRTLVLRSTTGPAKSPWDVNDQVAVAEYFRTPSPSSIGHVGPITSGPSTALTFDDTSVKADAKYYYTAFTQNARGIWSNRTSVSLVYDVTPPTVAWIYPQGQVTLERDVPASLVLYAGDGGGTGIESMNVKGYWDDTWHDLGAAKMWAGSPGGGDAHYRATVVPRMPEGALKLKVEATDRNGNVGSSQVIVCSVREHSDRISLVPTPLGVDNDQLGSPVLAPTGRRQLDPETTLTVGFATTKPGLVTIRYRFSLDPGTEAFLAIDGVTTDEVNARSNEPNQGHTRVSRVFLDGGSHRITVRNTRASSGRLMLESINVGLDTATYQPVLSLQRVGDFGAAESKRVWFDTAKAGLAIIPYSASIGPNTSLGVFVEGSLVDSVIGSQDPNWAARLRFAYAFVPAGKHFIEFRIQGAPAVVSAASVGIDTGYQPLILAAPVSLGPGQKAEHTFTLPGSGLVTLRWSCDQAPLRLAQLTVDGVLADSWEGSSGLKNRTVSLFLGPGAHKVAVENAPGSDGAYMVNSVTAGWRPTPYQVVMPFKDVGVVAGGGSRMAAIAGPAVSLPDLLPKIPDLVPRIPASSFETTRPGMVTLTYTANVEQGTWLYTKLDGRVVDSLQGLADISGYVQRTVHSYVATGSHTIVFENPGKDARVSGLGVGLNSAAVPVLRPTLAQKLNPRASIEQTFTTATDGLVTFRWRYANDAGSDGVISLDGVGELEHINSRTDNENQAHERISSVFLRAGAHRLAVLNKGLSGTLWIESLNAGLDAGYKVVVPPKYVGKLTQSARLSRARAENRTAFQTTRPGLLIIRTSISLSPKSSVRTYVDGMVVDSLQSGWDLTAAARPRYVYVYLPAGEHVVAFSGLGGEVLVNCLSVGLKPSSSAPSLIAGPRFSQSLRTALLTGVLPAPFSLPAAAGSSKIELPLPQIEPALPDLRLRAPDLIPKNPISLPTVATGAGD